MEVGPRHCGTPGLAWTFCTHAGIRPVIEIIHPFYARLLFPIKPEEKVLLGRGATYPTRSCFVDETHTQSHNSRWTAATHDGGWLSRLRLTRRRPEKHTEVSLAEHPQPGAAAAALRSPGSRRSASVWNPLRSGWETAAGRAGMSSSRRPPSSSALTSSRCCECGPLAPPTGPRAHGGPWPRNLDGGPGGISAFPLGLLAA